MSGAVRRVGMFKDFAQALGDASDEDQQVKLSVEAATLLVERCTHAGFTKNDHGRLVTRASSDDVVRRANNLQQELGEGPCVDVAREYDTVVAPDLGSDRRWPTWSPRVHEELYVGSLISVLVYTGTTSFGALSLYADHGERFDNDDAAIAETLAVHLASVITSGREITHLETALHTRTIVGQATGLVMGRFGVDASQAFDYLRRLSSHSNRKLVDIAREIVRTGDLPQVD